MLARCRRYAVNVLAVSIDCSSGTPDLPVSELRRVFDAAGVRLVAVLGFAPTVTSRAVGTQASRLAAALQQARELAAAGLVHALGEAGLDYYWPAVNLGLAPPSAGVPISMSSGAAGVDTTMAACLSAQCEAFRAWCALATELDMPLVVHERDAHGDARHVLRECGLPPHRVMFHCFGGTAADAASAAAEGYLISLPASVVYRPQLQDVARVTPCAQLLVETDSPYQSPIIGLWKQSLAAAQARSTGPEPGRAAPEREVLALRRQLFVEDVERVLPGVRFSSRQDGSQQSVSAREYFRQSRHRSRNEPVFVRYALPVLAGLTSRPVPELSATVASNAARFYDF